MTKSGPTPWTIDLSRAAAASLRALEPAERREVASRLDALAEHGPARPIGDAAAEAGDQVVELLAGGQRLVCAISPRDRAVVVVTMQAIEQSTGGALRRLAHTRFRMLMGGGGVMETIREVGQATRSLRRAPGFTATAVVTLALGIGASAAVFSVANGVLLRPLPYGEPDRVVTVWSQWSGYDKTWLSLDEYVNYSQQNRTLGDLALYFTSSHAFTDPENPELVGSAVVTPNTLDVVRVEPVLGRGFTWEEAAAEVSVVMLAYETWQRRYGGDPGVVGRDVSVIGRDFTVIGVLPEGFILPADYGSAQTAEIFFALSVDRESPAQVPPSGGGHGYYGVGRLLPEADLAAARADFVAISGRLAAAGVYPEAWNFRPLVFNAADDIAGSAKGTILFLLAACGLVLLIACANVASLLLSRSEGRLRDVAVRRALGAGSTTIVRGLVLESLVLALSAGALGLLFAQLGIQGLLRMNPEAVPRAAEVVLDGTVVGFVVIVAGLTAIAFGAVPAIRVARGGVAGSLHRGGRGSGAGARGNRLQGLLVASQMAMAVTLLAAAGLTMRAFVSLLRVDLGFETERVLTARLTVPSATYPGLSEVTQFWDELVRRVEEVPGVSSAGVARLLPLDSQMGDSGFYPVGYAPSDGEIMSADWQYVGPGYIETMGIPLVAGRTFEAGDHADAPAAMLLNQSAARRYWPNSDPIGSRVATFGGDTAVVAGIVGDIRHNSVTSVAKPRYYRAIHQLNGPGNALRMTLTARTQVPPEDLIPAVRSIVREMDPTMALSRVQTMEQVAGDAVAQPRFAVVLLLVFAVLATTLAVVGIYGVLAYAVSRRTQEIGVRMALGADRSAVVGMVVRQGMVMAVLGVAVGTVLAIASGSVVESLMVGVDAGDPLTLAGVVVLFAGVALVACWIPAARAARIPPTEALRYE